MGNKKLDNNPNDSPKRGGGLTAILFFLVFLTVTMLVLKIAGIKIYTVSSPSMSPALNTGDLVLVVPRKFERLQEGDIITYYINKDLKTATHRIILKNTDRKTLLTMGDNNEKDDGTPILYGNVVGKVVLSVPKVGYALAYFTTPQGKITACAFGVIFVILLFVWDDKDTKNKKQHPITDTDLTHKTENKSDTQEENGKD